MSDNMDAESNNLCIPEDAFDQFQAISMYQEAEYITLNEVPSKPKNPDPGELSHLSYDNEVVVTTENEVNSTVNDGTEDIVSTEQQTIENSCLKTSVSLDNGLNVLDQDDKPHNVSKSDRKEIMEPTNDIEIVSNNCAIIGSKNNCNDITDKMEQEYPIISTTNVPRKRGRKPKHKPILPEKVPETINQEISNISLTPFSSDPENLDVVTTIVKRKRGRPRKVSLPTDQIYSMVNVSDKEPSSEYSGSDNNRKDILSPSKLVSLNKGKKGRPRKVPLETNHDSQIKDYKENLSNDLITSTEDLDKVDPNKKYPCNERKDSLELDCMKIEPVDKDYKQKSDLDNQILSDISISDSDNLDDIALSKWKLLPEKHKSGETCVSSGNNQDTGKTNLNPVPHKKRRGRPKKMQLDTPGIMETCEKPESPNPIVHSITSSDVTQIEITSTNDDSENLSLSKLKTIQSETLSLVTENQVNKPTSEVSVTDDQLVAVENANEANGTPSKRNTKKPIKADFEYNIDDILAVETSENNGNIATVNEDTADNCLLVEDTSKRPIRRKISTLRYEEESDEDPFANVELSEDDEPRRRKGNRYYSDDEYIPGRRGDKDIDSTDSEINEVIDESKIQKRKKMRKRSDNQSPRKRGKIDDHQQNVESTEDDIQICLQPTAMKSNDDSQSQPSQTWGTSSEFENFLAKKIQGTNLKIKKLSSTEPTENKALEIPVIDPEAKKTIEMCSQTNIINTVSTGVQTSTPNDIPMKENIVLTQDQSEKACYFLNSIVKTTSELGKLMTQKSEDFITKKINTTHVTDTMKMDYCVKKSFLLFKLAKHNLMQMEEDLAKQYDEFLKTNNLATCREIPKAVVPSAKPASSDSDCEIVEEPVKATSSRTPQDKPKFNPKTVFLNKELSIKIAKKPTENKKLDIKGRHTVWINDTVMVKKVKPTQSFLAQDSRNKKPPDNITAKVVSNFFKNYYRQIALSVCAPFVTTDWLNVGTECACNYFVDKPVQFNNDNYPINSRISMNSTASNARASATNHDLNAVNHIPKNTMVTCPETLSKLCFRMVKNRLHDLNHVKEVYQHIGSELLNREGEPGTLLRLSLRALTSSASNAKPCETNHNLNAVYCIANNTLVTQPETLSKLCFRMVKNLLHDLNHVKQVCQHIQNELTDVKDEPVTLLRLSLRALMGRAVNMIERSRTSSKSIPSDDAPHMPSDDAPHIPSDDAPHIPVQLLKMLCHRRVVALLYKSSQTDVELEQEIAAETRCSTEEINNTFPICSIKYVSPLSTIKNGIKSLLSLCVELIQRNQDIETSNISILLPKSLKSVALEYVKQLLYRNLKSDLFETNQHNDGIVIEGLTINSINTLSEEAFLNLEQTTPDIPDSPEYLDVFDNAHDFETDFDDEPAEENQVETNWVSQVQMQELRSCCNTNSDVNQEEQISIITQIKLEPLDDMPENINSPARVKTEPGPALDEMTMIPDMKPEVVDHLSVGPIQGRHGNSYDVDAFEQFIASNKIMQDINEDIFSQSALRVRRQHEPDYDEENDTSMSLLVPQMYEPLTIETAKGSLMESSTDEESSKIKKNMGKKKPDKRNKVKVKKPDPKTNNKETPILGKDKATNNEVATLTKKMRDRIRQEEEKEDSTDSEAENLPLRLRSRKEQDKLKPPQISKTKESEIQCNNVDSTDQVDNDMVNFTGFTAIDQNEISTYQKYMKYVYDKILPDKEINLDLNKDNVAVEEKEDTNEELEAPLINLDEPVELLECEPTMPIFDYTASEKRSTRTNKGKVETFKKENSKKDQLSKVLLSEKEPSKQEEMSSKELSKKDFPNKELSNKEHLSKEEVIPKKEHLSKEEVIPKKGVTLNKEENSKDVSTDSFLFIDRHGWQCYPVNTEDSKLYQSACISLEKLPESFVQTYFEYQGIAYKDKNDEEIDRLTNLNSLNRIVQLKDTKMKIKSKKEIKDERTSEKSSEAGSRPDSPTYTDHYDELEPSDEEEAKAEDEIAQPSMQKQTENNLAKNLLMNDSDLDEPGPDVKKESLGDSNASKKCKPSIKPKKKEDVIENSADLMLTADKMMNKELTLLHAPIVLTGDVKSTPSTGPITRNKQKNSLKNQPSTSKIKNEEDSSSEEEKQWVTTKEKLLKRLLGRKEDASADDAKRAKLVTEFIERRGIFPDSHMRSRTKSRRSGKKYLERQKQLRVLSRELFGESVDTTMSKRSQKAQASLLYKGRRNIRKVIDKKSLARSTVVANMDEFERKRRLNAKQCKLRELLGCEEGVNVLVINDEVCLEYDFEENRPVVTIHPFFTKVMKAHQYEGVKFMWDACFESLAEIESGNPGGGCILAHCMGLGKTLQVLALLHTVLTHPRVGMKRVLVCCPLSTVLNWVDEIHKWIGPVTNQIKVFELSKLKKTYERAYQLEDWYNGGGIFIIGYELFRSLSTLDPFLDDIRPTIINKIRTALLDPGPDIIVCDEGHLLKNDCSVLAVAMSRVVTRRRIILTGTPMQNNLREYYCMVNFVKPNLLGTYSEYSNRFENPIMNGQHRDSREEDIKLMKARTHILHKVLEGCLQRQEASVLYPYLPKKHEYTVFITLTQCQWDLYKHYLSLYGKQQKQSVLRDFHILQKIWSHPQVLHNFQTKARDRDEKNRIKAEKLEDDLATEDVEEMKPTPTEDLWWLEYLDGGNMLETLDSSNKFVVVFRILDECVALGDKVLIFSTSLFCLDALEYFLKKINKWSLGQEYYRLDGSVPAEVRQKWCREFNADNNEKTRLFLVSTRAGCLGLNMTAANRVIIMDTSWNPAHDIQSIFRVYRFGQKKDCYIYRLVAMGTMEQKIYERSVTKQAVSCRVVDEQQIDRHYNMAELTELYKFDEAGSTVAGGVAVGVHDVALLRVARETALHAVHEHDSLLRGSSEQSLPEHERNAAWMQFQQEQAHKQMENKLIVNIPKIPNVSLKRLHGHDYAQTSTSPTEIKTEDTSNETAPIEPKAKKGKKNAFIKCCIPIQDTNQPAEDTTINKEIRASTKGKPIKDTFIAKPGTSKEQIEYVLPNQEDLIDSHDSRQEELMVEKITDILIKHNFQNKKGNTEIADLVAKVRNMIKKGYVNDNDKLDDLTASIARILLPKQMPLPAITDIMSESINNSVAPTAYVTEEPEVITSDTSPRNTNTFSHKLKTQNEPELRTKRKAAIAAEKSIDSLAQDIIINLDDDDYDYRDTDFVPNIDFKLDKPLVNSKGRKKTKARNLSPLKIVSDNESTLSAESSPQRSEVDVDFNTTYKTTQRTSSVDKEKNSVPKSTHDTEKPKDRTIKTISSKEKNKVQATKTIDAEPAKRKTAEVATPSSILLSDDEEPISNLITTKKRIKETIEKPTLEPPECNEIVPLPMSLLKNQNFINIVAHTYLVGNPMLDEDAATLAAQYSTLRALKEAEQTGKDVCSGPIYDIAVKVIGKEILKKMRSVNYKAASFSANKAAANAIKMKEQLIASEKISKEPAKSAESNLRDQMIQEKLGMQKTVVTPVETSVTVSPFVFTKSDKAVPVGLVKNTSGISANESLDQPAVECILPDDDDVFISGNLPSAAPPAHPPLAPQASVAKSSCSRPSILNHVSLKPKTPAREVHPVRVTVGTAATDSLSHSVPAKIILKPYKPRSVVPQPSIAPTMASNISTNVQATVQAQVEAAPLATNDTICLDSDEEETITPNVQPSAQPSTSSTNLTAPTPVHLVQAPVPVSLTMAHAPGIKLPLPPMSKHVSCNPGQQTPKKTLMIRQVLTADGTQPKYFLIPADKLPTPTLPKTPIADQPKPLSVQPQNGPSETLPDQIIQKVDIGNKINKARCKPGDIIRISKTGKLEVINRSEINTTTTPTPASIDLASSVAVVTPPKPAAQKPTPVSVDLTDLTIEVLEPKPASAQTIQSNKNPKKVDTRKARQISSSSSSNSSRAASPENPLSILKDVVHIRAADYPTTPSSTSTTQTTTSANTKSANTKSANTKSAKTTSANTTSVNTTSASTTSANSKSTNSKSANSKSIVLRTEKCSKSNISVQHVVCADSKNTDSDALKSLPPVKFTKVPKDKLPKFVNTAAEQQIKKEALMKKISPFLSKNQTKPKEELKPRLKNTINFDNLSSTSSKLLKTNAGKSTAKSESSKTSKAASGSKAIETVDLTNILPSGTTVSKSPGDVKKRLSSSTETTPVKKKKTERPMTLKDFNLDDIDDIIELE